MMAQLKISGLVELQKEIAEIAEMDKGEIANKMLKAGSKDVANTWYQEFEKRHDRHTGHLKRSIKSSRIKKNKIGRFTVTYPMGEEIRVRHGEPVKVRDAEKAFIDIRAEKLANQTMQTIWDDYLKQKGSK
jgi:hypothetical protein